VVISRCVGPGSWAQKLTTGVIVDTISGVGSKAVRVDRMVGPSELEMNDIVIGGNVFLIRALSERRPEATMNNGFNGVKPYVRIETL